MCSTVTVECCVLYPCCVGVYGIFSVMPRFAISATDKYAVGSIYRYGLTELNIECT